MLWKNGNKNMDFVNEHFDIQKKVEFEDIYQILRPLWLHNLVLSSLFV